MPDFARRVRSDPPEPIPKQPEQPTQAAVKGRTAAGSVGSVAAAPRWGVWSWDVASGLIDRTRACLELLSPQEPDVLPFSLPDDLNGLLAVVHPDDRDRVSLALDRAMEGSAPYDVTYRILLTTGETRTLHDRGDVFRGPTGQALRLVAMTTELVADPEPLVPSAGLLDAVPTPALRFGRDGQVKECNAAWTAATGKSSGATCGTGWLAPLHDEDREPAARAAAEVLRNGGPVSVQARLQPGPDSEYVWHLFTFGASGSAAEGGVAVAANIDGLKHAQLDAVGSNERLRAALTEGHHRIKNNLQTLTALIEIRLAETQDSVPASVLRRLSQNIKSLASLHELLSSQAAMTGESGGALIDARDALDKLLPLLEDATAGRPVELDCAPIVLTLRQATGLTLLVTELVSNAVKHGKGTIRISLVQTEAWGVGEERRTSPRARLEVTDEGEGFPAGFDPATSANTGLELVQMLARWDLGGQVFFANSRDGGARVVATFSTAGPIAPMKPVSRRRTYGISLGP